MNPQVHPDLYDSIILGTARSPGVVKITGHDRDQAWDNKEAKGSSGATSTLNGPPLAVFQCEFYLVVDYEAGVDEQEEWTAFQRVIESTTNGPKPIALPILHPDLARQKITEACNAGISGMVHDGRGGAKVIVKFQEHRPPKPKPPANATIKPSSGSGGSSQRLAIETSAGSKNYDDSSTTAPPKQDPNERAKAELDSLLAEASRTP